MIKLINVRKEYPDGTVAVNDINLEIAEGELLILLGESGCGKTTTMKMINRLIEKTSGTIEIDGEDNSTINPVELRRKVGYVFQGIGLFPHMTVGENVAIVPRLLNWNEAEIAERIDELLLMVQLSPEEHRDRFPRNLSGGQRQRVGLARALAARPKLMLMDEPFGAVDPVNRDVLQDEFKALQKKFNLSTVMVTHDMTEALLMADRIAVMLKGKLIQVGTPHELLSSPSHEYISQLLETPTRQADRLEALIKN